MTTLREALDIVGEPSGSAFELARRVLKPVVFGIPGGTRLSLTDILRRASWWTEEKRIFCPIVLESSPLGGHCLVTVRGNGDWRIDLHMENLKGLPSYDFAVSALVKRPKSAYAFAMRLGGSVGGQIEGGMLTYDNHDQGNNSSLMLDWDSFEDCAVTLRVDPDESGFVGGIKKIAVAALAWFVGSLAVGPGTALIVLLSAELFDAAPMTFSPSLVTGLLVGGAVLLIGGPSYILYAVVAGSAAGGLMWQRPLEDEERALADQVFKGSLDFSRIYITRLFNPAEPSRAFVVPVGPDIWINLGEKFLDPIGTSSDRKTLVHELVHAWQLIHETFSPDIISDWLVNRFQSKDDAYWYPEDGSTPWDDLNIEGQASAVAGWYSNVAPDLDSVRAFSSPLFHYVHDHIRAARWVD
jgi:hypothetical protein